MHFPLYIAKRIYFSQGNTQNVSQPAIRIATIGVAIGIAVMITSLSVVLGFKHSIRDKVVGFGNHIQVGNFMTLQGSEQRPVCVTDSLKSLISSFEGVSHVQQYASKQGILKTDSAFLGVVFKGIGADYDTTFIHRNTLAGHLPAFSDSLSSNLLIVSKAMANKLHITVGDKIFAYFFDDTGVRPRRFTISAVYQTNLSQYDNSVCYTDISTIRKLNGWQTDQAEGLEVTVTDFPRLNDVARTFIEKINRSVDKYGETYSSQTIQEANPQIFHWLGLLDLNIWIILGLMTAVAGITMISGLLIIILERTTMIGILKALGTRTKTIRQIFLWFATFIIGKGLIIGNLIAFAIIIIQQLTKVIKLDAATYYIEYVPVEFNLPLFVLVNIATLAICTFVLIFPSYLIAHIHPARAIKYE